MKKGLLGDILMTSGVINPTQLEDALNDQKRWGGLIGQHLIRNGAITPGQLLDILSYQLGIAKIDFKRSKITMEALQAVPRETCIKYDLVPVAVKKKSGGNQLLVAMSEPMNLDAIHEVEFSSNCSVSVVLALEEDIRTAIGYCYSPEGLRESQEGISSVSKITIERFGEDDDEAVIFTQEGRELSMGMEHRSTNLAVRVLVDILTEKGLVDIDQFRNRLQKAKEEE